MELSPSTDIATGAHRRIFNTKVFSLNEDLTVNEQPGKTSKHLTPQTYTEICTLLRNWGPKSWDGTYLEISKIDDAELQAQTKAYRKQNNSKYKWATNYRLETYVDSTGANKERLKRVEPNKDVARTAVPMNQVFDIISDAHNLMSSHAGRDNTYGNIKRRFFNITQEDVVEFIKTCPVPIRKLRLRKPNDQGSVEILNKFVKRLLTALEDEEQIKHPKSIPNCHTSRDSFW